MNENEAKARQVRLEEIKARIAELEAQLTVEWLELIDLRAKITAARLLRDEEGDGE